MLTRDQAADLVECSAVLRGKTALIVDDCRASLRAMTAMAMLSEIVVEECQSGAEAMARLRDARFDLVITDIDLPDMHGRLVASEARALGAAVLAVSADHGAASAPDAHAFIEKPFTSVARFTCALIAAQTGRDDSDIMNIQTAQALG